ncbi:MAG: hypothetical protein AAGU11_14630 [Syntrophobacteraceae bacterium]
MPFHYLDLLGKEFRFGARGPDAYDCYGLMIECRRRAGRFIPENYHSGPDLDQRDADIRQAVAAHFFTELPEPIPFCLVTFRIHPRFTTHLGMVLQDSVGFIHILRKMRVGIERLDSPLWARRISGYWECRDAG